MRGGALLKDMKNTLTLAILVSVTYFVFVAVLHRNHQRFIPAILECAACSPSNWTRAEKERRCLALEEQASDLCRGSLYAN
jgi:hypothetical protein